MENSRGVIIKLTRNPRGQLQKYWYPQQECTISFWKSHICLSLMTKQQNYYYHIITTFWCTVMWTPIRASIGQYEDDRTTRVISSLHGWSDSQITGFLRLKKEEHNSQLYKLHKIQINIKEIKEFPVNQTDGLHILNQYRCRFRPRHLRLVTYQNLDKLQ